MQFDGNIPPLFSSERILKIGYDLRKLFPKVWWLPFLEHGVVDHCIGDLLRSVSQK